MFQNKIFLKILTFVFTLIVVGCGSDSSNAPAEKELFRTWRAYTGGWTLDMSGANFGPQSMNLVLETNEVCECDLSILGTQTSGTYDLTNCTYDSGGGGDPGCNSFNESGTYTNSAGTLRLCDTNSDCISYY